MSVFRFNKLLAVGVASASMCLGIASPAGAQVRTLGLWSVSTVGTTTTFTGTDAANQLALYFAGPGARMKAATGTTIMNIPMTSTSLVVIANAGNDRITSRMLADAPSNDFDIQGGNGNDVLDIQTWHHSHTVAISGGAGNDIIAGARGKRTVLGGTGNDWIEQANFKIGVISAGPGSDVVKTYVNSNEFDVKHYAGTDTDIDYAAVMVPKAMRATTAWVGVPGDSIVSVNGVLTTSFGGFTQAGIGTY